MIEIKNLKKIYLSNDKTEVLALNDISFTLPDKGMFFIVGKSGCGKTTLLNLLGGIDKAKSGNILIDGKEFSDFSEKEFNVYRAHYAGFVFQNYNLISNLSVKDNLAFSVALKGVNPKEEDIEKILEIVDLQTYAKHLPQEMSCGQQQRVAISRAMLKKPKLVLADEPTGNLDSDTSRDIFDWLKSISQNALVVIVTHDLENAEKYGDGIIELLDGKIIKTTIPSFESNVEIKPLARKKIAVPFKSALNFTIKNMRVKIFLRIVAILLCVLAISQVGYMQSVVDYKVQNSIADTMAMQNIKNFNLKKYNDSNTLIFTQEYLTLSEQYQKTDFYKSGSNSSGLQVILIENSSDIAKFGFTLFDGFSELDKNSVYLTDGAAYKLLNEETKYYTYENETFNIIKVLSEMKGNIYSAPNLFSLFLNVAGLINTNYQYFVENLENLSTREKEIYEFLNNYIYFANNLIVFGNEEFLKNNNGFFEQTDLGLYIDENNKNTKEYVLSDFTTFSFPLSLRPIFLKDGNVHTENDFVLRDDEIIIPLDIYNILLGTFYTVNNFYSYFDEVIPPDIAPEFDFAINLSIEEELPVFFKGLKVVGFCLDPMAEEKQVEDKRIFVSSNLLNQLRNNLDIKIDSIYGIMNNKSEMKKLLKENKNFRVYASYSTELYNYEREYLSQKSSYLGMDLVMISMAIALLYYVISSSISEQKKNIGIMRSMGASRTDILKIYLLECAFIALIIIILSMCFTLPAISINNTKIAEQIIEGAIIYKITYSVILELLFIPIATILFSAILPLLILYRKKPIDLIKDF